MKRVVLAIIASMLITSCAGGPTPISSVAVTMDEWSIGLARNAVAGPLVNLALRNAGMQRHELAIVRSEAGAERSALPADRAGEDRMGNVVRLPALSSGQSRDARVELRPGRYLVICDIPTHYHAGMRAPLEVQWP